MQEIATMTSAQAGTYLGGIAGRATALLNSVDPTQVDERAARFVTKLLGNVNRFDASDLSNLASTIGATLVTNPDEVADELENVLLTVVDQQTHESILANMAREEAGTPEPVGVLSPQYSGCCCNCLIGYIDEAGNKFSDKKVYIRAIADFDYSCHDRKCT